MSGHSIFPGTSFQLRLESSVSYPSTRGWYLGSGFCRGGEYTATWPIGVFDADSKAMLRGTCRRGSGAWVDGTYALTGFSDPCLGTNLGMKITYSC